MDIFNPDAVLGLPYLERAEAMFQMQRRHNWDHRRLAEHLGISVDKTSRYLTPIKICKKGREFIREASANQRPSLGSLELICRLTPALQEKFLRGLPRSLTQRDQVQWIKKELVNNGVVLSRSRLRSSRKLRRIDEFLRRLDRAAADARKISRRLHSMTPPGRETALDLVEHPQRGYFLSESMGTLISELEKLQVLVASVVSTNVSVAPERKDEMAAEPVKKRTCQQILDNQPVLKPEPAVPPQTTPAPSSRELLEAAVRKKMKPAEGHGCQKSKEVKRSATSQPSPTVMCPPLVKSERRGGPRHGVYPKLASEPVIVEGNGKSFPEITVSYFDERLLRIVLDKVSPRRYVELAREGLLKHQQQNMPKPAHLPDPAEVAKELGLEL